MPYVKASMEFGCEPKAAEFRAHFNYTLAQVEPTYEQPALEIVVHPPTRDSPGQLWERFWGTPTGCYFVRRAALWELQFRSDDLPFDGRLFLYEGFRSEPASQSYKLFDSLRTQIQLFTDAPKPLMDPNGLVEDDDPLDSLLPQLDAVSRCLIRQMQDEVLAGGLLEQAPVHFGMLVGGLSDETTESEENFVGVLWDTFESVCGRLNHSSIDDQLAFLIQALRD